MSDYKYGHCRTFGHSWQPHHELRKTKLGTAVALSCGVCPTICNLVVSRATGEVVSRSYDYPDNYKDDRGYMRQDFRKEWLRDIGVATQRRARR